MTSEHAPEQIARDEETVTFTVLLSPAVQAAPPTLEPRDVLQKTDAGPCTTTPASCFLAVPLAVVLLWLARESRSETWLERTPSACSPVSSSRPPRDCAAFNRRSDDEGSVISVSRSTVWPAPKAPEKRTQRDR